MGRARLVFGGRGAEERSFYGRFETITEEQTRRLFDVNFQRTVYGMWTAISVVLPAGDGGRFKWRTGGWLQVPRNLPEEIEMVTERFWKIHWLIAVWHNIIGGVGLMFLGDWVYQREGLQPPTPGVNYVRWMLLIMVFCYMYYMVYKDLYNTEKLVRAGILGKIGSASPDLYYLVFKVGVAKIFWITVCSDFAFALTFFLFLRWVGKQKDLMAQEAARAHA